jgi:hypothetical protein
MDDDTVAEGGCHCGALRYRFEAGVSVSSLATRTCGCSYCVKAGAVYASDPHGRLILFAENQSRVHTYQMGHRTASFVRCPACGVYVCAVARFDGGREKAVLNVNTLDDPNRMARPGKAFDFEGETSEARMKRRGAGWIGTVEWRACED